MKNKIGYPYKNIKDAYDQDQKDREKVNWDNRKEMTLLDKGDIERIKYVKRLLDKGLIKTKQDCFYGAMLFHHSEKTSDLAIALSLSYISMRLGSKDGKWLYARALDRFLLELEQPQKFGTQFEEKNGKWSLCNYDKATTDKERKLYEVPSLDHQQNVRTGEIANE